MLWRAIILITYITHTKHVWVPHGIIPRDNIPARGCAVGLTAGGGGDQIGWSALPRRDMTYTTQCVHRRTESELWVTQIPRRQAGMNIFHTPRLINRRGSDQLLAIP